MVKAFAVGLAIGAMAASFDAAVAGFAYGADVRSTRGGVSFQVPKGWRLTTGRINGVFDPVTLFTVSTFRLRPTPLSSGICSRALQRAWRRNGAYVQLAEERDGRVQVVFAPRPTVARSPFKTKDGPSTSSTASGVTPRTRRMPPLPRCSTTFG